MIYTWINPKNRFCATCKQEKPKEEFYQKVSNCKVCMKSQSTDKLFIGKKLFTNLCTSS